MLKKICLYLHTNFYLTENIVRKLKKEDYMKKSSKIIFIIASILIIICVVSAMAYMVIKGINRNKKVKEKIVYASIVIQSEDSDEQSMKSNTEINDTYEALMNSKTIKNTIEEKYGKIRDVEFETVKDTQIVKVIYVCDEHTDEECKKILQEWITEFSKRIEEIYNIENVYIVDNPEITTRMVEK